MAHFAGTRQLAFVVRASKIQGKGAFATRRIKKGARIIEYLGECIDEEEADIRYPDDEMGRHHTFLFAIGDGSRVLDAGPIDWPAKYINHSCAPNCEAIEEEDGRVFISAMKEIPVGVELLYDYAYERTPEHTEADEKMYVCRCGAPECRGTIMAPPKKVKSKKKGKKKDKKGKKQEKQEKKKLKDAERAAAVSGETDLPASHAAKTPSTTRSGGKKGAVKKKRAGKKVSAAKKSPAKKGRAKKAVRKGAA